jgi:DNA primase
MTLTPQELARLRDIRIHSILGLRDDGRRIAMRCPFHNEKSASFTLYPDNSFHCYGCGANGSGAIDFCMKLGYTFVDSLTELVRYL